MSSYIVCIRSSQALIGSKVTAQMVKRFTGIKHLVNFFAIYCDTKSRCYLFTLNSHFLLKFKGKTRYFQRGP